MIINPVAVKALQNVLSEIASVLSTTTPLPEGRTVRCLELIQTAKALIVDMEKRAGQVH